MRVAPRVTMLLATAAIAAGCSSGSGADARDHPPIAAAPPGSASALATPACQRLRKNEYAIALSATVGSAVRVRAHPAHLVCGGVDDSHYASSPSIEELVLTSSVQLRVLVFDNTGPTDRRLNPSKLAGWLRGDHNGRIFMVTGSPAAVTALTEMYHP